MRATATFLFCDLVDSTGILVRLGPERGEVLRRSCFSALRRAVASHQGQEIKSTGDGLFIVFGSGSEALDAASEMQRAVAELDRRHPSEAVALRVGLSVGEANHEDDDWFGAPVIEAARLCDAAEGGQVLTSQLVSLLFGQERQGLFSAARPLVLKGLGETSVCAFDWRAGSGTPELPPALGAALKGPFVGRGSELEVAREAWRRAVGGEGRQALLIGGEPGIGKTRLAAEVARWAAESGGLVAYGRSDEDMGVPYQAFVEVLRQLTRQVGAQELETRYARLIPDLSRLMPELLASGAGSRPRPAQNDLETDRYLLFESVRQLMSEMSAERPVLVVLDDLHWAAAPTLLMLRHLLASLHSEAVMLLATYRDTELVRTHPLGDLLADLRRMEGVQRLPVRGLEREAVTGLLAHWDEGPRAADGDLGPEGQRLGEVLLAETQGNPFFLREMLSHLSESGAIRRHPGGGWSADTEILSGSMALPEGVKEVVGRRLRRLSERSNQVLAVASVIGARFSTRLVEAVAEAPDDQAETDAVLAALEEAESAGLLVATSSGYAFAHALVRQTLYEEISPPRRARLHGRIGEALLVQAGAEAQPSALAHHFAEAAPDLGPARAVEYALAAARSALQSLANEEAEAIIARAVELARSASSGPRVGVGELHLLNAYGLGRPRTEEAKAALREAIDEARALDSHSLLARAVAFYALICPTGQPDPQVEPLVQEALGAVAPEDRASRSLLLSRLALYRAVAVGDNPSAAGPATHALELARQSGDGRPWAGPWSVASSRCAAARWWRNSWRRPRSWSGWRSGSRPCRTGGRRPSRAPGFRPEPSWSWGDCPITPGRRPRSTPCPPWSATGSRPTIGPSTPSWSATSPWPAITPRRC